MVNVNGFRHKSWKGWLSISLRIVLALVLLLFVVYPNIRRVLEVSGLAEEIVEEKEALEYKLDRIKLLGDKYPTYSELLDISEQYLPGEPLVLGVVTNLIADATNSELSLEDFRYDATAPVYQRKDVENSITEGVKSMIFSVTGDGSYPEFKSFLVGMEEERREIQLTDLRLRKGESGESLIFGITGRFFWK
ncbi:hypothetical protein KJ596_02540 [Patescibacteria group bacterium]|nr:hypothetical protein [Patescibacteria group bacterium]MBU1868669.1 hypothetical protein [Patescibacteria group bacterium]